MRARMARPPLAAAIVAALAISGCGDGSDGEDPSIDRRVELIVGDVLPLSGPDAGLGTSAQKAAQLAVGKINDAIGEADVDHTLEIVHQDGATSGARAVRRLLRAGARCMVGPWRIRPLRLAARRAMGSEQAALLIDPRARVPTLRRAGTLISLPLVQPTRVLELDARAGDDDPSAEFAQLFATTDPPSGRALAADARQFDSVILCYLAAVAAGTDSGPRMAASVREAGPTLKGFGWPELAEAVERLQRGVPITYRGVTLRARLRP
jgi:hypothetical protein